MTGIEDIPPAQDELAMGLLEFYSSQATVMLAQYDNIIRLLGLTKDWTAPGTHCEVLLRNFLRNYLPSRMHADKGFIYGRHSSGEGTTRHCPEIDILIHSEERERPLFRLDDFVIIEATTTYGAIQVKRCMTPNQLKKGIQNIVEAKEHYRQECGLDPKFCSAILFFEEDGRRQNTKPSKTYRNCLQRVLTDPGQWSLAPDLIGSLKGHILVRDTWGADRLGYACYSSEKAGRNIALQVLLARVLRGFPFPSRMSLTPQLLQSPDCGRIEILPPSKQ